MKDAVLLSCLVAGLSTALAVPTGTLAAWWLARRRGVWRLVAETVVLLPIVLPPLCVGYALLVLFGARGPLGFLGLPFTTAAAVLAAYAVSVPFMIRAAQAAFEEVDPELEDAARVMGAGEWEVFRQVTLPGAARGVLAGAVLAFARAFGEFGATILFAGSVAGKTRTVPLAIFHNFSVPGGESEMRWLMAAAVGVAAAAMAAAHFLFPKR